MSRLSDVSLPSPDSVASVVRNGISVGTDAATLTTGASAAAAGLSGTPLAALVVLLAKGYGQEKGVEWTAKADEQLDDLVERLDDDELAQHCLGRVLRGVRTLLPQSEQYRDPALRTAEGEPENLAALFQGYQENPERRREIETAVERVLAGEMDQAALDDDHDDFLDYLRDVFRVQTRDEALSMFLDFRELLQAREVQETLAAVEDVELDTGTLSQKLDDTERRLADRLDDVLEAGIENEGFHRLNPYYFDQRDPQAEPATCWRVGFQPADVRAGYALEREKPVADATGDEPGATARQRVTPHLVERLRGTEDVVVTGLPGSGKSTILQSVACEWYEQQHGTVFYRRNGESVSPFEDTGTLAQRIDDAEGHVLVVVEDAVREDANAIFETLRRYESDPAVSLLLDARASEWREYDRQTTDALQRERMGDVTEYPVPRFDERECERVIAQFESTTGYEVAESPAVLFEAIETDLGAGQMYLLGYRLSQYAVGAGDGDGRGPTGLRSNVRAVYNDLSPGDPGDDALPLRVGLLVSLLTAAEVGVHREFVYALARNDHEYRHVVEIVENQQGRLVYGFDGESRTYRVNHPLWGLLFLEEALERNEELTVNRFEETVNGLFELFDDPQRRGRIASWASHETELLDKMGADENSAVDGFVLSLFDVGVDRPVLAPLFGTTENSGIDLPDACAVETKLWCINKRGTMFKIRGGTGRNPVDVSGPSDPFSEFSRRGDDRGTATATQSDLERAAAEYRHRLALAERSDAVESAEFAAHEAGCLLNLGLVAAGRGDYETAEARFSRARSQFDDIGHSRNETKCLMNLGDVARQRGNYGAAEDRLSRAKSEFNNVGDSHTATACLMDLGDVAQQRGNYGTAEDRLTRARSQFKNVGDSYSATKCLNNLGLVARQRGNYETAEERLRRARSQFEDIGGTHAATNCLMNLGDVARQRGNYEAAEDRLTRARGQFDDIGDTHGATKCLSNLGSVARHRGDYDTAEDRLTRARSQFDDIGDTHGAAKCLLNLGLVDIERKNYPDAEDRLTRARDQFDDIGDTHRATACLMNLGAVALNRENYRTAEDRFGRARDQFEAVGDEDGAAKCESNLGRIALNRGHLGVATDRFERAREWFRSAGDVYHFALTTDYLGEVVEARGDLQQACDHFETALETFLELGIRRDAVPSLRSLAEVYESLATENPGRVRDGLERMDAVAERTNSADLARRLTDTAGELGFDEG